MKITYDPEGDALSITFRDTYVKQHQHDVRKIVEDLRRWDKEHPSKVVDRRRQRRR